MLLVNFDFECQMTRLILYVDKKKLIIGLDYRKDTSIFYCIGLDYRIDTSIFLLCLIFVNDLNDGYVV